MKTLVACKVLDVDSMAKLELEAFSKALQAYETVLPKASYKCATDEPCELDDSGAGGRGLRTSTAATADDVARLQQELEAKRAAVDRRLSAEQHAATDTTDRPPTPPPPPQPPPPPPPPMAIPLPPAAGAAVAAFPEEEVASCPRYFATATGYDDSAFQEAIRGQSEEAFFSDFRMFTPVERTPLVTSWAVHMAFSIQEDNGAAVGEFVVVPSKTVVPADGPLQVLRAGKLRRMEIVLQAATQTRCFSRCKRVLLGAPCITDRYPSSIDERRKSYHAMMHAAKELQVTLPIDPPQRTLARSQVLPQGAR